MRTLAIFISISLFFIIASTSKLTGQRVFPLKGIDNQSDLHSFVEFYSDLSCKVTIDDLLSSSQPIKFEPNIRKDMNFGFKPDALWLKLAVQNISGTEMHRFFQIKYPTLNNVHLYLVSDNKIVFSQESGTDNNFKNHNLNDIYPSFDLKLENQKIYYLYLRIKTNSVKIIPISFLPVNKHSAYNLGEIFIEILLMGFVFGFGVYILILFFQVRMRMFLFIGLTFILLSFVFFTQYGYVYLVNSGYWNFINNRLLFIDISISYIFFILFSIDYLKLKQRNDNWYKFVLAFLIMYGALFLLSLFPGIPHLLINAMFVINYLLIWILFLSLSLRALKDGDRSAVYYLFSIILFFSATFTYFLVVFKFLRFSYFLFHLSAIAACIDAVLFTLGLSQIIIFNALEKQKSDKLAEDNLLLKNEISLKLKAENELLINQIELEKLYKNQTALLEEKENNFKYLVENLSDWVWQINMDKKFTLNNHKLFKLLGYQSEELFEQPILQLVETMDCQKLEAALSKCLKDGKGFIDLPVMLISKSNKAIPMEISCEVIRNHNYNIVGLLGISRDMRQKRGSERNLLKAIHGAEENERKRLSIEIHDGIGPILNGIHLYLSTILLDKVSPEKQIELMKKAKQSIQDVSNEIRQISNNLMPVEFINNSLSENISLLVNRLTDSVDLSCSLSYEGLSPNLTNEQKLVIYRIISELMNNTIKHAKASMVNISFQHHDNKVSINFSDNGIGFDTSKILKSSNGLGLHNIQSRLKTIDATYQFLSTPGKGMSLNFSFRAVKDHTTQSGQKPG